MRRMLSRITMAFAALALAASAQAATEEKVLCDFEDGKCEGWVTEYECKVAVEDSDKAHGKKWMSVELSGGDWPGARFVSPPPDWSEYRALRVAMYNPTPGLVEVSFRADDVDGTDYESRYNRERGIKLKPGANDVEISLASLRMGTSGSRGLDVGRMKLVSFYRTFPGGKVPFALDHLRLVPADAAAPPERVLADFDGTTAVKWHPAEGVAAAVEKRPDGLDGSALRITFPARGKYSRVALTDFAGDWLSYDLLALDVLCPKNGPMPHSLFMSVSDDGWSSQWLCTALEPGLNRLRVPTELIALPALGKVRELALFVDYAGQDLTIRVDNLRLERRKRIVLFPEAVHMDYEIEDGARIDFRPLELGDPQATWGAVLHVPLDSGDTRMVRCTCRRGGRPGFAIDPAAFRGMRAGAPVEVWGYFRARSTVYWARRELRVTPGAPATLRFDDLGPFGF